MLKGQQSKRRVVAMRTIVGLLLSSSMTFWPAFVTQRAPAHLKGIVVSENGTPIEGVKIFALHDSTTDADGKFDLPSEIGKATVIFFQKEGFRPKSVVVKSGSSMIRVVLEDDGKTAWFIPVCRPRDANTLPKGYSLAFRLPKAARLKKLKDIDYQEYLVTLGGDAPPLQLWWGGLVQPGQIVSDLIVRSANFEERSIHGKSGEYWGTDTSGKSPDGTYWRAAGFAGLSGAAIYENVSEEVAKAYDRIIDSACQADISPKF